MCKPVCDFFYLARPGLSMNLKSPRGQNLSLYREIYLHQFITKFLISFFFPPKFSGVWPPLAEAHWKRASDFRKIMLPKDKERKWGKMGGEKRVSFVLLTSCAVYIKDLELALPQEVAQTRLRLHRHFNSDRERSLSLYLSFFHCLKFVT